MQGREPSSRSSNDSLEQLLRDIPTDEKQGATATQGFSFQQWWAALRVAEMLGQPDDFAVGIEVKEDVALLDSADVPTKVEFCQIKKNEQAVAWTLSELHAMGAKLKTGGRQPSTLAKLYKRRVEFKGHPTKLMFVSNTSYKVPAEDSSTANSHDTHLADLTLEQQEVVKKALATQLGISETEVNLSEMRLHRTDLPLRNQEVYLAGMLSGLSESGKLPFAVTQPTVAARVLASEMQSKASNTHYARTFDELKDRLFTRNDAIQLLAVVSKAKPILSDVLDEAIERLNQEQYPFIATKRIKNERIRVCAEAVDRTNLEFRNLALRLLEAKNETLAALGDDAKLCELMDSLIEVAKRASSNEFTGKNLDFVKAIALLVLNDGIDINLFTPAPGEKPKEEK